MMYIDNETISDIIFEIVIGKPRFIAIKYSVL